MKASLVHEINLFENSGNIDGHPDTAPLLALYKKYVAEARAHMYGMERRLMKSEVIPDYNHKHITTLIGRANSGRMSYAMWMVANVYNMLGDDKVLWVDETAESYVAQRAETFKVAASIIAIPDTHDLKHAIRAANPSMLVINTNCITNTAEDERWAQRTNFMRSLQQLGNDNDKYNKIRAILVIDQARGNFEDTRYDAADYSTLMHAHVAYGISPKTGEIETLKSRWTNERTVYKEIPNHIYDVIHGNNG